MSKETKIMKEKKKDLTDAELIAKYGNDTSAMPFDRMIGVLLSTPNPNALAKAAKNK